MLLCNSVTKGAPEAVAPLTTGTALCAATAPSTDLPYRTSAIVHPY